jgi:acyl-lipid omega-6 desaturase (Delta-12 desaturase)
VVTPVRSPTIVRAELADLRQQSWSSAATFAGAAALAYLAAFAGVLCFRDPGAVVVCSAALGPLIALLFRIAHDAGHHSHFRDRRLNSLVGHLCILPSYHPYSVWLLFHNKLHHGFTNLRSRDYIWIPLSKSEYDRLTPVSRAAERLYRSAAGVGLYYGYVIWWRKMMRRPVSHLAISSGKARRDRMVVGLFLLCQLGAIAAASDSLQQFAALALAAVAVPFAVFCWMVGYVSFFNHTHPRVPWFARAEDWSFFGGQLSCTVHMSVPMWLVFFLTDLGLHGSHHFEPRVPIWRLPGADDTVKQAFSRQLVIEQWTFRTQARILRTCKLYDYDAHRWLDYAGVPTACVVLEKAKL